MLFASLLLVVLRDSLPILGRHYLQLPRPAAVIGIVGIAWISVLLSGWFLGPRLTEHLGVLAERAPY